MIVADVNVLVAAAHRDATRHEPAAAWLAGATGGATPVGLTDLTLTGAVRILTSPRVFADPLPPAAAAAFVEALRGADGAYTLAATGATWARFEDLLRSDPGVRGNLVPDAWLAAVALSHGASVATWDRGFARFRGLTVVTPGEGGH